jgi:hypothetical protein
MLELVMMHNIYKQVLPKYSEGSVFIKYRVSRLTFLPHRQKCGN